MVSGDSRGVDAVVRRDRVRTPLRETRGYPTAASGTGTSPRGPLRSGNETSVCTSHAALPTRQSSTSNLRVERRPRGEVEVPVGESQAQRRAPGVRRRRQGEREQKKRRSRKPADHRSTVVLVPV